MSSTADISLPSISMVVPNYNGGATIGQTLQSLIDQQYPTLQIIVVDGGSTDNSVQVIKQFEPHLHWWVSEKDQGQAHAINKGFAQCSGEIVNWLCSDDHLEPGALDAVGRAFAQNPQADLVAGKCRFISAVTGEELWTMHATPEKIALMPCDNPVPQPSTFYRRKLLTREKPIDESLHYAMDFDLWMSFIQAGATWHCIDAVLSEFVTQGDNKSATGGPAIRRELNIVYKRWTHEPIAMSFWHRMLRQPLQRRCMGRRGIVTRYLYEPLLHLVDRCLGWFYNPKRVRAMDWRWTMK